MTEWLIAMVTVGVWYGVFQLEKIARSAAKVEKDLAGLRYQVEQLQERGSRLSSELHDIKINTFKMRPDAGNVWDSARWSDD